MYARLSCLIAFMFVLCMVGDVKAGKITWIDAGADHLWSTEENWDAGTLPTYSRDDHVHIPNVSGPIIANKGAVAGAVAVGPWYFTAELTVAGGTLEISRWLQLGQLRGSNGTLYMKSGTITVAESMIIGYYGSGTFKMTGGSITVTGTFQLANQEGASGVVQLHGGIYTANNLDIRWREGAGTTMDIGGGTLILNGNLVSKVQGYIDNGWITAYGGRGTLHLDYDVSNAGKTTLTATSHLNPNPADDDTVLFGEVELSWTLPDPCLPGQPVPVDVYFCDDREALEMFADPAAIQIVSKQNVTSVVVQTQEKTRYYWAVDTYVGDPNDPIFGPIFSFFADNLPPEVDAGTDLVTWLAEDGVRIKNLDATVTDNEAYTLQWKVVSEPNDPNNPDAVIADPSAEDTNITLSTLGEYVLQLEAFDGEYTGSDTITIKVYNDGCEAAQSLPDYEPFPGDLNGDCKVDEADMALLEENWLQDNALTDDWSTVN